jgi:uncharacterized protein (TIGR02453 family)
MSFTGIPSDALAFYRELEIDNTKPWWEANKDRFRSSVREPLEALAEELGEFGPFHMFRPHNDLRFNKNRPRYKTQQGAFAESEGGAGYYFHLSADGLMCGAGYYAMAKDQLERFRAAVDDETTGTEVEALVSDLVKRKYSIGAIDELKSAPRGFPKDHPRIELLRRKGLMTSKDFGAPKWLHTKKAASRVRETWEGAADLCRWLDTHVGPSSEPPDGRFG